jgi:hypothetical protein
MNAYELALHLQVESSQAEYGYVVDDWKLLDDAANMLRQQADRIAELEKEKIRAYNNGYEDGQKSLRGQADRIAELEFENKAFRDELFKRGSMDSCSQAAALHGFVSPKQAGDDAREYIANVLKKASEK